MGLCHSNTSENVNSNNTLNASIIELALCDFNLIRLIYQYLSTYDIIQCRYVNHILNNATYNKLINIKRRSNGNDNVVHEYAYTINSYQHGMLLTKCMRLYPRTIDFITTITINTDDETKLPIQLFDLLANRTSNPTAITTLYWHATGNIPYETYPTNLFTTALNSICKINNLHILSLDIRFTHPNGRPGHTMSMFYTPEQLLLLLQHSPNLTILNLSLHPSSVDTFLYVLPALHKLEYLQVCVKWPEDLLRINMDIETAIPQTPQIRITVPVIYCKNGKLSWLLRLQPTYKLYATNLFRHELPILCLLSIKYLHIHGFTDIRRFDPLYNIFGQLFANKSNLSCSISHLIIESPDTDIPFDELFAELDRMQQLQCVQVCGHLWTYTQLIQLRHEQPQYIHAHNHSHVNFRLAR